MTRGTLLTTFESKPYDELRRLGLTPESEEVVRSTFPDQTGMLTIAQVVPGSPADGKLEPGDILIRINGDLVTEFVPLAGCSRQRSRPDDHDRCRTRRQSR